MFFLSAAKCDFGFVTVFVTQEHCINVHFVWDQSYVSINERKVFFFFFIFNLLSISFIYCVLFLYKAFVFSALAYK